MVWWPYTLEDCHDSQFLEHVGKLKIFHFR